MSLVRRLSLTHRLVLRAILAAGASKLALMSHCRCGSRPKREFWFELGVGPAAEVGDDDGSSDLVCLFVCLFVNFEHYHAMAAKWSQEATRRRF